MTFLVSELITKAYYVSGVVAREFETVSGAQMSDGLDLFNDLLSIKSANIALIPYYKELDFTAIPGVEKYHFENLIKIETLTFNIGPMRFPVAPESRVNYFSQARADNVSALPFEWRFERTKDGGDLFVYFPPQQAFPMKLWGKFSLLDVTLDENLELTYDRYYIAYLRYALAEYICTENNIVLQPQSFRKLQELEEVIRSISPADLSMQKLSTLTRRHGTRWSYANIFRGWWP